MKRKLPTIIFQFSISLSLFLFFITNISAQKKAVETSGDSYILRTPVFCLTTSLLKKDYHGTKQFVFSAVTAVGTSYILKHTIRKKRPDGSDYHAFRPDMQPSPSKELPFYNADMAGNSVSLLTFYPLTSFGDGLIVINTIGGIFSVVQQ